MGFLPDGNEYEHPPVTTSKYSFPVIPSDPKFVVDTRSYNPVSVIPYTCFLSVPDKNLIKPLLNSSNSNAVGASSKLVPAILG